MPAHPRDLSALIGSRICHDLISPIGAIGNGVELLAMSGVDDAPEIALIVESVENANARIRFFRIAFGAATNGQSLGRAEIISIIAGITKVGRLEIDWRPDGSVSRLDAKLAFLCLLCLETAMPWGGNISVARPENGWSIIGRAQKLKLNPELWEILAIPAAEVEITSGDVQFALAADLSRRSGRPLRSDIDSGRISLSF